MQDRKKIAHWLILGCILIITMIIIGGVTRLTHSGLSMTTWKPITGIIPPLNKTQWLEEFENYKRSPEFKKINFHFNLKDFKSIFWWEYIHRLLGRLIGIIFLIPFLYFIITKKIKDLKLIRHLIVIFLLGGFQGFVGWFMVKSGLVDNPHVSHYRLSIHLFTALFLCAYIFWIALSVLTIEKPQITKKSLFLKKLLNISILITLIQIVYGALVAGLKAGWYYPTYPKMGEHWIPPSIYDGIKNKGVLTFVEQPISVQFIHRYLAVVVLLFLVFVYIKAINQSITLNQKKAMNFILISVGIQFLLGVLTLLMHVPLSLAILHQLGAVILLTSLIYARFIYRNKNLTFVV